MSERDRILLALSLLQAARHVASQSSEYVAAIITRDTTRTLASWGEALPTDEEAYTQLFPPAPPPAPAPEG